METNSRLGRISRSTAPNTSVVSKQQGSCGPSKNAFSPSDVTRRIDQPFPSKQLYKYFPKNGPITRRDAAQHPELGSVSRPGPKKGGSVFRKDQYFGSVIEGSRNEYYHNGKTSFSVHSPSTLVPFNKERYLQANCQFVVVDGVDYESFLNDPDRLVDWENIEEVRLASDSHPNCPICLCIPTACKITRCGHVYCWPCILHYLALSDRHWRKCPICFEAIDGEQLRSAVVTVHQRFQVRKRITLVKMRREKKSSMAMPVAKWSKKRTNGIQHWNASKHNDKFAKLFIATSCEAKRLIIDRERRELSQLLERDCYEPEAVFITSALEALSLRESTLLAKKSLQDEIATIDKSQQDTLLEPSMSTKTFPKNGEESVIKKNGQEIETSANKLNKYLRKKERFSHEKAALSNDNCYYFYQALDGQPVFLHSVNARSLTFEYGSLFLAPDSISGLILQLDSITMTTQLRDRFRNLAHLPLSTNLTLVELKLDRQFLSNATIETFADEFEQRRNAREMQKKEDERREIRQKRWETALLLDPNNTALYNRALRNEDDLDEIPVRTSHYVRSAQFETAVENNDSYSNSASISANNDSIFPMLVPLSTSIEPNGAILSTKIDQNPPSFAQMLMSRPKMIDDRDKRVFIEDSGRILENSPEILPDFRTSIFEEALQMAFKSKSDAKNAKKNRRKKKNDQKMEDV